MTQPTQQEIDDQLAGFNRTQQSVPITSETEAARNKALANYQQWFRRRKILIYQDKGVWKRTVVLDNIGVKEK